MNRKLLRQFDFELAFAVRAPIDYGISAGPPVALTIVNLASVMMDAPFVTRLPRIGGGASHSSMFLFC